jgi:ABC-2 type transport system permease protein
MLAIIRTAIASLRRDKASLALSFVLPIAFFGIFAMIFGNQRDTIPRVNVIVVDQDQSTASRSLVRALLNEDALHAYTHPEAKPNQPTPPDYTAATAAAAVKAGDVSVALIIPPGWGANPVSFGPDHAATKIEMLNDPSDPIAPQVVTGMLQKDAMTSMPATMANEGFKYEKQYFGDLTPEQQKRWHSYLDQLNQLESDRAAGKTTTDDTSTGTGSGGFANGGFVPVQKQAVLGQTQNKPIISFYAAAIGVMFLLFTASGAAGSLLDEADSGTLDRVLSSRIGMTTLLAGKLGFNMLLAFAQLTVMFLFAWSVFHVDLWGHIPGFVVMGVCTAFAVAAFGILLASICKTRAQLGALSTLLILVMSSIGGSMFPRYLMSPALQKAGLFTINAWAIDGFTKVFWRDQPIPALWPQIAVLLAVGAVLFLLARRIARRWEFA